LLRVSFFFSSLSLYLPYNPDWIMVINVKYTTVLVTQIILQLSVYNEGSICDEKERKYTPRFILYNLWKLLVDVKLNQNHKNVTWIKIIKKKIYYANFFSFSFFVFSRSHWFSAVRWRGGNKQKQCYSLIGAFCFVHPAAMRHTISAILHYPTLPTRN
jgi:hypothetical protein